MYHHPVLSFAFFLIHYFKNIRTMSALGIPRHVGTIDPKNVEHILKSKVTCNTSN